MSAHEEAATPDAYTPDAQALVKSVADLLILVFIHGFKGDDETFLEFPKRLQHILTDTVPQCTVESIVFPVYEVRNIVVSNSCLIFISHV